MTNKLRTLLFTLGSTTAVVAPIAAVVACGDTKPSDTPAAAKSSAASDLWNKVFKTNSEVKVGSTLELGLRGNSIKLSLPITSANEAELKGLSASTDQAGLIKRLGQLFFGVATDAQKQQGLSEVEVAGTIEYLITGVMPQQPSTGSQHASVAQTATPSALWTKLFKSTTAVNAGDKIEVALRGGSLKLSLTVNAEILMMVSSTNDQAVIGRLSTLFAATPEATAAHALANPEIYGELSTLAK